MTPCSTGTAAARSRTSSRRARACASTRSSRARTTRRRRAARSACRAARLGRAAIDERVRARQALVEASARALADGRCAALLLVLNDARVVANLGDSRAVMTRPRRGGRATASTDHQRLARPRPRPRAEQARGAPVGDDDAGGGGGEGAASRHTFPWARG